MKWCPSDYAEAAVIAREAGQEMVTRLDWMTVKPKLILDIGCGTGEGSELLQERYPNATVISFDIDPKMLNYAQNKTELKNFICANANTLPILPHCVDLIFANFFLPWQENISILLQEWRRVLRSEGLLMVTALGPDTLKEWHHALSAEVLPHFVDMHDLGDLLVHSGFNDPVLDVSRYTLNYRKKDKLLHELQASGMWMPEKNETLESGQVDVLDATYEVIYAHAFAPLSSKDEGVVKFSVDHLRQQLREKNEGTS